VLGRLACDGDWRLSATRADGGIEGRGGLRLTVSRHDVENAEIRLALTPVRLSG